MAESNFSLQKTLTMLLDEKKYHSLRDILSTMNPADIAAIFDDLDQARLPLLFRLLPKELAAETFVEMEPEAQELLIQGFSDSELKEVIDELYVDDAVDIVEEMPANVVQRILTQAEPDMRKHNSGSNGAGNSIEMFSDAETLPGTMPNPGKIQNKRPCAVQIQDKKGENTMVNKVRVNIAGTPYAIATTDSEKYILGLAKKLDEDITKLLDTNDNLSVTKAAVFCAMDYLDEYRKSTGSAENMRSQIQDYIADAARAKLAEDKAKAENEVLRREAAALREQLAKERRRESRREERAEQAAAEQAAADEKQG